ncbi:NUDIX domain protein [Mycolicibacterium hassiacum DSM 44199]|uniref:NUDIX domain protein n=1 Tax=Mycolicibacterium hassiacum (strain DSM 44199 / CIP 105218 / JCM 12690 / 3849) TaxID=1122247 RepID=K5BDL9_MYCHD|nr:NUDIX domain-containing protein [Mycolicibacterium hassiacum]EKF21551.1 NUDIX domain protein [Mycolicibacterium hassiacum DSM 44199]MBX5485868.1 NUDIX domain-containing protein [Mycolicibacterium hassiacum]MDA4088537.1 NUDIX hydrolase [Mycolicibacterium hassiacum DSM 44199]PZN18404.1 MAG: NUDIX domain-containing protein [Mycolicibacterium hassiacum]VCT90078.1 hypothetical protein MHAS_01782 [Mycolicibacterium hassiacum DSM 44199]
MPKLSAGLLLYRIADGGVEVLIGHPGGPFFARRDEGVWSIPKGEYEPGEDPWAVARREFEEEVGKPAPDGPRIELTPVRQASRKIVTAYAVQGDLDLTGTRSNTFTMEWPKGSGQVREFPEIDRVAWFPVDVARSKLLRYQVPLLDELAVRLAAAEPDGPRSR